MELKIHTPIVILFSKIFYRGCADFKWSSLMGAIFHFNVLSEYLSKSQIIPILLNMYSCMFMIIFDISSCNSPKKNCLFLVDLILDKEGCHYSTNLNNFEPALVGLFNKGIDSTQNVPQLEKVFVITFVMHS